MKNFKRILSAFLTVAMIAGCFVTTAFAADGEGTAAADTTAAQTKTSTTFSDIKGNEKYAEGVHVLNKLGIITGYEDGTFRADNNVSRAEFTAMLLRMLGFAQAPAVSDSGFSDIPSTHWAIGQISAARNMNIVTGYEDGTFRPDNNVSYEEALTMIVRAIGYENYSQPGGEWYSKYVTSANRLGIPKNANGAIGTPATRACIAQFIYATLEVNTRENDDITERTVMEEYLGLIKQEGIIASNAYTSLDSPDPNLKEDEIKVLDKGSSSATVCKVENIESYTDMLGERITYYYKDNTATGYRDIIFCTVNKNAESLTIDAENIDDDNCSSTTIAYYKTESASTTSDAKLDRENIVIYNGKLYGRNTDASRFDVSMLPNVGSVKLVNNDTDSEYDILFIESYDTYAVSSVTSSTYTVTDKIMSSSGRTLVLDPKDDDYEIKYTNAAGDKLAFSNIKKNNTLCVKKSNEANGGTILYTVAIVDKTVTGEVKGISSKGVTVNDKQYKYSKAAPWEDGEGDLAKPEKGTTYTFFLDMNGEIVAYTKSTTAAASMTYGYIMNFTRDKSTLDKSPIIFEVLTQSGTKTKIAFYDKTKINGQKIANEDYDAALETLVETAALSHTDGGDGTARQLIKYSTKTVDGNPVFDSIVTVTDDTNNDTKGGDAENDTLRMYGSITSEDSAKYTSSSKVFKSGSSSLYLGSAVVFVIPETPTDYSGYRKGSASDFKNNKNYKIEAFDISTSKTAKVVVYYGGNSSAEVDYTTPLFRIDSIESEYNTNKDTSMVKVSGYENGASGEKNLKSYWVSPDSERLVNSLDEGDFVRFGTDNDGFVTLASEDIIYQVDETEPFFGVDDEDLTSSNRAYYRSYEYTDHKFVLGSVYKAEDNTVVIVPQFLEDGDTPTMDVDSLEEVLRLSYSKFSGAKFYRYKTGGTKLDITEITDDYNTVIESLTTYDEVVKTATTKVFVHVMAGTVKTVVIIEE